MKNSSKVAVCAIIAAIYIVLTVGFAPLSYAMVQFRLAEILNLMAFINPIYGIGVVIGCFISNLFSPLGPIDWIVGTSATAFAVFFISKTKNLLVATLWPTIFSGLMVGAMLTHLFNDPLGITIASVAIGQFVVVTCVGYPVFRYILKNKRLMALLHCKNDGMP
jgi:uncharacterized membrane protein